MELMGNCQDQENKAYELLKYSIIDGSIPPGYRLVERDLGERFSMSRTPIRAAINRLVSEGLAERAHNKGVSVSMLSKQKLVDFLYIREGLEGMAARQAATNRNQAQVVDLLEIIEEMKQKVNTSDLQAYYKLSGKLHQLIFHAAHNEQLHILAIRVNDQVARYQYRNLMMSGRAEYSIKEHTDIVNAIADKDADKAQAIMQQHIANVRELIIEDNVAHGYGKIFD